MDKRYLGITWIPEEAVERQTFNDALLLSALNGEADEAMCRDWLYGKDLDLALKLCGDAQLREALRYLLDKPFSVEEFTQAWRKTRTQG